MLTNYFLMRKDTPVTVVAIDELGNMRSYARNVLNKELAPIQYRSRDTFLQDWWKERKVPITQARIKEFLKIKGYSSAELFLVKNLGLSLTDYYWIKPVDSSLSWKDVSLFSNDFRENALFMYEDTSPDADIPIYSPNSSLQGDIEKTWIIRDGKRCLIKGNRNNLSSESINEVIASKIHELQGYGHYTNYDLIRIKDKPYDYGCICESFTSEKLEFISAWALYSSEKKPNNVSSFEHYINICGKYGADMDQLRKDLEYQILTDFIISGYDRHMNNFGMLRDAETLRLVRSAPIFDSGGALFVNKEKKADFRSLLRLKVNGLAETERKMLEHVRNKNCIDLDRLPSDIYIRKMYEMDTQIRKEDLDLIVYAYNKKIDICNDIQKGKDPWKTYYAVKK